MVERPERNRIERRERAPAGREWEVFVRDASEDPLRHAGSVRARGPDDAYELASKLFGWYASDLWLCPAEAMVRYTDHDLAEEATPAEEPGGEEPRSREWS